MSCLEKISHRFPLLGGFDVGHGNCAEALHHAHILLRRRFLPIAKLSSCASCRKNSGRSSRTTCRRMLAGDFHGALRRSASAPDGRQYLQRLPALRASWTFQSTSLKIRSSLFSRRYRPGVHGNFAGSRRAAFLRRLILLVGSLGLLFLHFFAARNGLGLRFASDPPVRRGSLPSRCAQCCNSGRGRPRRSIRG